MAALADFLRELFSTGVITHRESPQPEPKPTATTLTVLKQAYETYRLGTPGSEIPFVSEVAFSAAEVVRQASWFLVSHQEPPEHVQQCLQMSRGPNSPGCHLSADLTFRYLSTLHRRARARDAADVLTQRLMELLRQWPLSGVLATVEEPPLSPLDFGHDGLWLCYAERFAQHPRQAWLPTGKGLEVIELAWQESGKSIAVLETWKHSVPETP